jgi:hypothetical protein
VIETEIIPATAHQRGHIRTHFHWANDSRRSIRDPLSLPQKVYGWGTQDLKFPLLLQHLSELCFAFGFPVLHRQEQRNSLGATGTTMART